jgi:hypothetical protein
VPDGSTEKPDYPHSPALLYAFCVDGLDDPNAMLRRLLHAERDDMHLPKSVVVEVRDALWDRVPRLHDSMASRPPSSFVGVARPAQRRSI